ncbi:hypothetical protein SE92_16590 [Bradyrhizobium sp. AT1]|uniref:hypothetical protein n=1 Tax=Bradyrhizobium sp. AT1 TaxID=574934 RepID=UPI0007928E5A|nr:hypothetical protein [Bradyrhizobium sp. AT1]KYG21672.1 hypothetical protein SE92_16590 [Bradyrhizobium sp. AT1]
MRPLLCLFGLAGALWSFNVVPLFWLDAPAEDVAARILINDRFKPDTLTDILARLSEGKTSTILMPAFARAKAVVNIRAAEEVTKSAFQDGDHYMDVAEAQVRSALNLNPHDSFLWLMLYSVDTTRNGFNLAKLDLLDQSYATGPLEGWIALRRNRIALNAFPTLTRATQASVLSEFAEMIDANLIEEAAANLTGVGWAWREELLAGVDKVDIASRQRLAKVLSRDGIKVRIPGIEESERPW